jgi:hypothetical protein
MALACDCDVQEEGLCAAVHPYLVSAYWVSANWASKARIVVFRDLYTSIFSVGGINGCVEPSAE